MCMSTVRDTVSVHNIVWQYNIVYILYQETAVSAVCCSVVILIIELVLYYRRHDLYAWTAPNKQFGQVK